MDPGNLRQKWGCLKKSRFWLENGACFGEGLKGDEGVVREASWGVVARKGEGLEPEVERGSEVDLIGSGASGQSDQRPFSPTRLCAL